jgi:hypothetical protein
VECDDALVADESDEREVLTNLPRTRPARRSTRRTTAASEPKPKRAPAKPKPKPRSKPRPGVTEAAAPSPPPLPPALPPAPPREAHRSPLADVAVAGIELTGALLHFGISLTRAVLSATLGRVPRP